MKKGYSKMILLLKIFWLGAPFKSFYQKKGLPGLIPLLFLHGSPTKYPKSLSLWFGVHQTSSKKVTETIFFIFSILWWPPRSSRFRNLKSVCQEDSKMVWHLHIGPKMSPLETPEVFAHIWSNSVEKFEALEWPLLEVRRFFQWCQEMSLGILGRF